MIAELLSIELLGYLGGALFFSSWLIQAYETRQAKTVTISAHFFAIRTLASMLLVIESIRVKSFSLVLVNVLTCLLMIYNLWIYFRQPRV